MPRIRERFRPRGQYELVASVDSLQNGSLGFFWPIANRPAQLEDEPERGYLRCDEGWAVLDVLDEDPYGDDGSLRIGTPDVDGAPRALVGMLPEDSVLLVELRGPWLTKRIGPRASSKIYRARTVIGHAPIDQLRGCGLLGVHVHYHGLGRWAGLTAAQETQELNPDSRLRSWTMRLESGPGMSRALAGGRTLEVSAAWRVDGTADRRIMSAPVAVGCRSRRPTEPGNLLQPIVHVQNLIGFAFGGFVAAHGGTASLDVADDGRAERSPSLWNGDLMVTPQGAREPTTMTAIPLFHLETIGGIDGLARWVRLNERHPRAVSPVTMPYRIGPTSAALTLMEVAAGIEYWVKANRPASWATKHSKRFAQALAARGGAAFSNWVGDPEAWAKAFWGANNHLKHEPTYVPDPIEVGDLATSARYLLGATLLDRAAGTKEPSRTMFAHHRINQLGTRLRDRYA